MARSALAALSRLLVGNESRQRLRAAQALLSLAVYGLLSLYVRAQVAVGLVDGAAAWALTAYGVGGAVAFYTLIRSGWNLRLPKDRALTVPQSLWAMVGAAWQYGISGPARGVVTLQVMLVIVFGIFALTPQAARRLAAAGFALLGGVMAWKGWTDPAVYDPRVEASHFALSAIVVAACAALSIRLGKLRARLEAQRASLAEALERIQALATQDALTGLMNRRAAVDRLQSELNAAPPRMALALIDLDRFKRVNDTWGHAAGDMVLRRFAERARARTRASDVLARWGGEEFLLVMPGAGAEQALARLDALRADLAAHPLDEVAPGFVVTFSAGVAERHPGTDLETAIERADRRMYAAKQGGRDRSVGPGPEPEECATLAA